MRTETIAVEDAVGKVLCHDITRMAKGEFKGPLYRKGHVISADDIGPMHDAGKDHVYVIVLDNDDIHEDDAGLRLGRSAAGDGVYISGPVESRVNLIAAYHGVLKVDTDALDKINTLPGVVMATLPTNSVVAKGDVIAGTKVVPLAVKDKLIKTAESILDSKPMVRVVPFRPMKAGVVITGNEICSGRVNDAFGPVLSEKLLNYGSEISSIEYAPDGADAVSRLITDGINRGADLIMVTGGMSVDPDDITPSAIRTTGAEIVTYGTPVMPGAMFMLAYLAGRPVLGVPACGMFFKTTILDLILPRVLTGEQITRPDIVRLGHGGLCRSCKPCHYPACSFGSGGR